MWWGVKHPKGQEKNGEDPLWRGKNPAEFLSLPTCKKGTPPPPQTDLDSPRTKARMSVGHQARGGAGLYVRIPAEKEVAYLGIHQKTESSPKSKKLSMFIVDIFVFLCFWEFLSGMWHTFGESHSCLACLREHSLNGLLKRGRKRNRERGIGKRRRRKTKEDPNVSSEKEEAEEDSPFVNPSPLFLHEKGRRGGGEIPHPWEIRTKKWTNSKWKFYFRLLLLSLEWIGTFWPYHSWKGVKCRGWLRTFENVFVSFVVGNWFLWQLSFFCGHFDFPHKEEEGVKILWQQEKYSQKAKSASRASITIFFVDPSSEMFLRSFFWDFWHGGNSSSPEEGKKEDFVCFRSVRTGPFPTFSRVCLRACSLGAAAGEWWIIVFPLSCGGRGKPASACVWVKFLEERNCLLEKRTGRNKPRMIERERERSIPVFQKWDLCLKTQLHRLVPLPPLPHPSPKTNWQEGGEASQKKKTRRFMNISCSKKM